MTHHVLSASQVLSHLARLKRELGATESGRVLDIVRLLNADTGQANVASVHRVLSPNAETDTANKALSRLIGRVNSAAAEAHVDLRMHITTTRSAGAENRFVWFEQAPALQIDSSQPSDLQRVGDWLIEDVLGELMIDDPSPIDDWSNSEELTYDVLPRRPRGERAREQMSRTVDALGHLVEWAQDDDAPRVFALLGEYGIGKTITCQRLLRRIDELRDAGMRLPKPLYVDLRGLSVPEGAPMRLIDVLRQRTQLARATDELALIGQLKREDRLFIFDGLDEALTQITETRAQHALASELVNVSDWNWSPDNVTGVKTKVLISCRTHFFRSIQAQHAYFAPRDLESRTPSSYRLMSLLRLTKEQVRFYFRSALPDVDMDTVFDIVRSVHNLEDLTRRPYTLRLVCEFIPSLERMRNAGKRVFSVTLYRAMIERWLHRDDGKHHIRADHKLKLMTDIAERMWPRERTVTISELERWFDKWLDGQPELAARYRGIDRDKLEEDLRTATFLVREDLGAAGKSGFRFAHSSIHEFFLALYLLDALRENKREKWAIAGVTEETHVFLSELLMEAEDAELAIRMGDWRAPYMEGASELWLDYVLACHARDLPAPNAVGVDMRGANLQERRFHALSPSRPLNLSDSRFDGSNLRQTSWENVRLERASFDEALLDRADWFEVNAAEATLRRSRCTGARFVRCSWPGSDWSGAQGDGAVFAFTEFPEPWSDGAARGLEAPSLRADAAGAGKRLVALQGHASHVRAVSISPDSTRVVSAGADQTLKLWHASTGRCLMTWSEHSAPLRACAYSPGGPLRIVSGSADGVLKLWDPSADRSTLTIDAHQGAINALAFSPSGRRIVSAGSDGTLRVWDSATGKLIHALEQPDIVTACAYPSDETLVVYATRQGTLALWNLVDGQRLLAWQGHSGPVNSCTVRQSRIYTAGEDKVIRVWDLRTGQRLMEWLGHAHPVRFCALSRDGSSAVSGSEDGQLILWDAHVGRIFKKWAAHSSAIEACAYSIDGTRVVSASEDGALKMWDAHTQECIMTLAASKRSIDSCAYSLDGKSMVSGGDDGELRLWDAEQGHCLMRWSAHDSRVVSVAFADGTRLASLGADGDVRVWDVSMSQAAIAKVRYTKASSAFALSRDGKRVVTANEGTLNVCKIDSDEVELTISGHDAAIRWCAYSRDGTEIFSASEDGMIGTWNAKNGRCSMMRRAHEAPIRACALSHDGKQLASASADGTLKVWDLRSGGSLAILREHRGQVTSCAYSPDGAKLVSASLDGTLKLWNVESARCTATWRGHSNAVSACAFSPDGRFVLSAGQDGAMLVWDVSEGRVLRHHVVVQNEHAVWRNQGDVVEASEMAWRWLGWQIFDAQGYLVDTVHAEKFGPLPAPSRLSRR